MRVHLVVLARSGETMCSAYSEVSVGVMHVGDVSELTEYLDAPSGPPFFVVGTAASASSTPVRTGFSVHEAVPRPPELSPAH